MATIHTLENLQSFLAALPEGATADILASDLEAGNFEVARLEVPDARFVHPEVRFLYYDGPVAEGYVSPFETRPGILKEEYQR